MLLSALNSKILPPRCCVRSSAGKDGAAWGERLCAGCLVGLIACGTPELSAATLTEQLQPEAAVFDGAKMIPTEKRQPTNDDLLRFEQKTGWRLRLLTAYRGEVDLSESDVRAAWKPDSKTVIVAFDPSSPNIVAFRFIGDAVQAKLKRPFWVELQSRFGNQFFVRQEGEAAAVDGVVKSVQECLVRPEGCPVVPGLSSDQFFATLCVSVAGGIVLGFSSKLDAESSLQRLGWILGFSPLWLILFVNLGLGPIVARTDDRGPILLNAAAFLAVALLFQFLDFPPKWMKADVLRPDETSDGNDA